MRIALTSHLNFHTDICEPLMMTPVLLYCREIDDDPLLLQRRPGSMSMFLEFSTLTSLKRAFTRRDRPRLSFLTLLAIYVNKAAVMAQAYHTSIWSVLSMYIFDASPDQHLQSSLRPSRNILPSFIPQACPSPQECHRPRRLVISNQARNNFIRRTTLMAIPYTKRPQ